MGTFWLQYLVAGVLLINVPTVTDAFTVHSPPEHLTYEQWSVNVTCWVEGVDTNSTLIYFRWTRESDPDFIQESASLLLERVMIEDGGDYTCYAQNQDDPAENGESTTAVIVQYQPRWQAYAIKKFAASIGETTNMECKINAYPQATFYWQLNCDSSCVGSQNMTSSPDRPITDVGDVSMVEFKPLASSHYADYCCNAVNDVGRGCFILSMREPEKPDSPQNCAISNITDRTAIITCYPGYAGGEDISFPVYKNTPNSDPIITESSHAWLADGTVEIDVRGLGPNLNYTLRMYQENVHGRSEESFSLFIRTEDGPPLDGPPGMPPEEMWAIIGGVVGGVLLVVLLISVVVCVVRKKKANKEPSRFTNKKDTQSYVMEEDADHVSNVSRDENNFKRQSANRASWGSFRRKKPVRPASSGQPNNAYLADTSTPQTPNINRVIDYNMQPRPLPFTINISHDPGESGDGFENPCYQNDTTLETSFNDGSRAGTSTPTAEVLYRRQMSNPVERANRMSSEQPGLAGVGAMSMLPMPQSTPNIAPMTPNLKKDRRLSLEMRSQPQHFEPDVPWEFPRERLYIRKKLGEGSFGEIWKAKADGILGRGGKQVCAVKMLKANYTPEERRAIIKELDVMKQLQPHPNVVQLLGCCSTSDPLCIIMEYAPGGNLQDMLRKQRSAFEMNNLNEGIDNRNPDLTTRDLIIFILHIASGMDYISAKELLHRDLATRNVLLGDQMVCKICDFGSSRDIIEMRQYESKTQRRLPLRWMAPESLLQCQYSIKSDVWAFGIVMWEILTLGSSPYPGMSGPEVIEFVQKGCRMAKPRHISDAVGTLMKDCCNQFPPKRPSFSIIRHRLVAILDDPENNMYVDQMAANIYEILEAPPGEKC